MYSACSRCANTTEMSKFCKGCHNAKYCCRKCQRLAWPQHKVYCVSIRDVWEKVLSVPPVSSWKKILFWQHRFEEMLELPGLTILQRHDLLHHFVTALRARQCQLFTSDKIQDIIAYEERRGKLLAELLRFKDQGTLLCYVADCYNLTGQYEASNKCHKQARRIAEDHGFYSIECLSCRGHGQSLVDQGNVEEGLDLLRNATIAGPLCEGDADSFELCALDALVLALVNQNRMSEATCHITRLCQLALEKSENTIDIRLPIGLFLKVRIHAAADDIKQVTEGLYHILHLLRDNEEQVFESIYHFKEIIINCMILLNCMKEKQIDVTSIEEDMSKYLARMNKVFVCA